jgi:hypothetical protein
MSGYAANVQYRRAPAANSTAVISEAPGIFQRSMKWRNKRDAKIKKLRSEKVAKEGPASLNFDSNYKEATVGEHLDAYHRYNMLVGEADGGVALPEAQYRKLEKRCAEAAKDRLFCTWRNTHTLMDCVNVGPMTRCFCGHSYRAHAFYRNQSKKVHCRVPDCKCNLYNYVYHRGGRAVKCQCKHELALHRDSANRSVPCRHPKGCNCHCFVPTVTCTCEQSATMHETVYERRSEREEAGRLTRALWEEMEQTGGGTSGQPEHGGAGRDLARANRAMAAGAGGLTSYLSLAPGTERVLIAPSSALPMDSLRDIEKQMNHMTMSHLEGPPPQETMPPQYLEEQLQYIEQQPIEAQHEQLSPLSKHVMENSHKQPPRQQQLQQQQAQPNRRLQPRQKTQPNQMARQRQKQRQQQRQQRPGAASAVPRTTGARYQQRQVKQVSEPVRNRTPPNDEPRRRRPQQSKKQLPSYMRTTKAMEMWKTQTEEVKKKPRHLRKKEIY